MCEIDSDGVEWFPDAAAQNRIAEAESLTLGRRGLTSHLPETGTTTPAKLNQSEIWKKHTIHKFTVAAKLRTVGMLEEALKLEDCHSFYTVAICGDCGLVRKFPNRCDLFFCPECAPHLQNERVKQVKWWAERITQPKHVILTIKNTKDLCAGHIDELRAMFTKLRRRKFATGWRGGFYSLQVTNQGKGWHLHLHALVDARWIDEMQLKEEWRSVTNGMGYNVKVKDARAEDYLREVTRYVIHSAQLASWQPDQLREFLQAFQGKRTFGVFGSLYGVRTEFAEWVAELKQAKPRCECGSSNVSYRSEAEYALMDLVPASNAKPRPPPANESNLCLFDEHERWHH